MTIWILAIVLFLIWAGLGFLLGFFRTLTMLVGTWVGALLAAPVGNLLMPYLPKIKMTSQFWNDLFAPWIGFFLIQLVFLGIAFAVHWQVAQKMRYRANEITFHKWQRLVSRTGLAVGLVIAFAYLTMVGTSIYALGYATVQVTSESNPPKGFPFLNTMREDLAASGFDKYLASRDETPDRFYQTADILGLVYHTPTLMNRLRGYPGVLAINERSEIQDLNNDSDINQLVQQKGDFTQLYNNEKIQDLAENESLKNALANVDLIDLKNYLETGETDAFEERIVGRWKLDNYLAARDRENRAIYTALPIAMAKIARQSLITMNVTLINTPEGEVYIKSDTSGSFGGFRPTRSGSVEMDADMEEVKSALGILASDESTDAEVEEALQILDFPTDPTELEEGEAELRVVGLDVDLSTREGQKEMANYSLEMMESMESLFEEMGEALEQQFGQQRNSQGAGNSVSPDQAIGDIAGIFSTSGKGKWEKDSYQYKINVSGSPEPATARIIEGDLVVINNATGARLTFYKN